MLRKGIIGVVLLVLLAGSDGRSQNLLDGPETVVYDSLYDRYLVSNMNTGNIVQIDRYGSYSNFVTGLTATYGMTILDSTLYVCVDAGPYYGINGFDLATGSRVFHSLPSGTYGLNGITADTSGFLYMASTGANTIYRIYPPTGFSSAFGYISIPNAVCYDAHNHRLLATSNVWYTPVYEIPMTGGSATTVPTFTGQFSGLAQDGLKNTYIAYFASGRVYRYDSLFTAPQEQVISGQSGPEGICFDRLHSQLIIPNLMNNTVRFLPLDVDIWMECDTSIGTVPFTVSFSAGSALEIDEWNWNFGDGTTAMGQSPIHNYELRGNHDVRLEAITAGGDTLVRIYPCCVAAIADTFWTEDVQMNPDSAVEVVVNGHNSIPVDEIRIPVEWTGDLTLAYDSFSTAGCRTDFFMDKVEIDLDNALGELCVRLRTRPGGSPLYLGPGSGPLMKIYYHAVDANEYQTASISIDGYDATYETELVGDVLSYSPVSRGGEISLEPCCGIYTSGLTGNANCSEDGKLTLSDITMLIDRVYISREYLCCDANGNTNGSIDGKLTLSDITRLIDVVYISRNPAGPCL